MIAKPHLDPIPHIIWFKDRLKEDLITYESITKLPREGVYPGGVNIGMALTAFAALDLLAFVIHGGELATGDTSKNFNELLKTRKKEEQYKNPFGNSFKKVNHQIFYKVLRNGLMHQSYPKNVGLGARPNKKELLIKYGKEDFFLNAPFLLKTVVKGYEKFIRELIKLETSAKRLDANIRLYKRSKKGQAPGSTNLQLDKLNTKIFDSKKAIANLGIFRTRIDALRANDKAAFLFAFEKLINPMP